ncbi:helix-turn-helix domain-containing protein [Nocardia transvalensis]|uniref:helix-turn-helix domain-containing protein n=1 Tax=Nocardia transvalensis TaxID=37333 RepID=UPI001893C89D|nr:helix-turn-helix transcriptional regulator [Nocardia transvalensis]MBF6331128.1 helix-turn-helix transcriptional regulator [Nocardia transvalensis]
MERRTGLARTRRDRGQTQETLAHRLGVDVSSVARWERGTSTPSPRLRVALARELGLRLDELACLLNGGERQPAACAPTDLISDIWTATERDELVAQLATDVPAAPLPDGQAVRVAHQWLIAPPPPAVTEMRQSGRGIGRIGTDVIERIRARLRYLREADDLIAGGDLHGTVRAELARTANLLGDTTYTERTGRELLRAVAELCQLAGWSTADASDNAAAERYYLNGIRTAHAAGDLVLAAQIVSSLGYHMAETGGPARDAVLLTRSALARMDNSDRPATATPTVRALLHARNAWTHAVAGDTRHAADEIQRAQDEYSHRTDSDPDPTWAYWLTPEEMNIITGRVDTVLGRPLEAQQRLGPALRHCDPRRLRETTLYTIWLAEAHLRAHDVDGARALATSANRTRAVIRSAYSDRAVNRLTRQLVSLRDRH